MLKAPGLIVSFQGATSAVMSLSKPASTWAAMMPPPHDWKRSGTSPDCIDVASLVLNASFSRIVMLILTLGWAAVYASAIPWNIVLPGSPVVICHHSIVTGAAASDGAAEDSDGASDAATDAAADAAAEGAVVALLLEQALNSSAMTPSIPTSRQRVVTA